MLKITIAKIPIQSLILFLLCNNESHSWAWSAYGELCGVQPTCRYMKNILVIVGKSDVGGNLTSKWKNKNKEEKSYKPKANNKGKENNTIA